MSCYQKLHLDFGIWLFEASNVYLKNSEISLFINFFLTLKELKLSSYSKILWVSSKSHPSDFCL